MLVLLIALTGCQQQGEGNTINVAGNAELTVEPDEAEVWAGISIVKIAQKKATYLLSLDTTPREFLLPMKIVMFFRHLVF